MIAVCIIGRIFLITTESQFQIVLFFLQEPETDQQQVSLYLSI